MPAASIAPPCDGNPGIAKRLGPFLARFRGDIVLTGGTLLTPIVGFVTSLVAARYVLPEELGVLQSFMLLTTYCGFLHLGVFNGLNRDIAVYLGKGDSVKVQALIDASWRVARLLALGGGVFATLLALGLWLGGYSAIYYGSALCVAAWLATDPLYNHLECVFRGTRHFGALGIALTFQNCFGLLVSFLPAFFGAGGMILGRALQGPARILMRIWKTPLRAVNRGRFEDIRELCRSGVPILMAGTLYSFLAVADRSLATVLLTPRDVGNLALSGLVIAAIQLVPTSVGNLLYPRIGADYGRTGSTRSLRRFVWIGLGIGGITLVPGCLLAYFFVEPVTLKFLPKYSDGIAAAKINSLGSLAFISFSLSGIIAVVRRMRLYIGAIIASLLIAWLSGAVLIRAGYGIEAAAYARAISTGLLAVFTVGYAYALTNGKVDGTTPKDDPA